ncbi:hypothetical protein IE4872_PD01369 (plasmid) [Rhizobium gallicum]|uniref:Uncharacterized protein n=1 Tax=Rhizobium gallicum TaxID=56730 RepID=A0A1L5NVE9_9HYPH|nr:hypothetical protein IE4872_PD01369 [Rhizobium gallicum]
MRELWSHGQALRGVRGPFGGIAHQAKRGAAILVFNLAKHEELAEALRGKLWPASVEALLLPKRAGRSRSGGIC